MLALAGSPLQKVYLSSKTLTYLGIPNQASGVVRLDVVYELVEHAEHELGPVDVVLVLALVFFQNAIGVKHCSVLHFFDMWTWCR